MNKKIYLIRHAESVYNAAESAIKEKFEDTAEDYQTSSQYLDMKFDLKYEDCDITPTGFKQCEGCYEKMKGLKVDLIIVSPLRRAIMTCYQVFKGHKSNAPVMVDPTFREIMESSCDIGSRLKNSMKDYPDFDFSLI